MDTLEIDEILDDVAGFLGAFAYDILPEKPSDDFSMVVNTSSSSSSGDHWVVLCRKKARLYFIDSYGRTLKSRYFPRDFVNKLTTYIGQEKFSCNEKWLQRLTSNTCGAYCVYFIRELSTKSFRSCLSVFTEDLKANDTIVSSYLRKL